MFQNLDIFRISSAMARHAGTMQAVAAENVANSDTPAYKARTLTPFAEAFERDMSRAGVQSLRATRAGHLGGQVEGALGATAEDETGVAAPNGNTVSLEGEMLRSLNAKRQHDRALAIYKSSLGVLRATLNRS